VLFSEENLRRVAASKDPYKAVDAAIDRINTGKLKAMPVSLYRSGGSLYVQGTFPPKLGELKPKRRQLPLGLKAHIDFMFEAQNRALQIGVDLMLGKWVWDEPKISEQPVTVAEFVKLHQASYLDRNGKIDRKADTLFYWKKDFLYPFNKLPQDKPPSVAICQQVIETTPNNTRTRARYVKAYRQLLELAGIDASSFKAARGKYKSEQIHPASIPEIKDIIEWSAKIPPQWKFYYFLLACFGLRGTEAHPLNCRLEDLEDGAITVYAGKTQKWRYVPTCSHELFIALKCDPVWHNPDCTPAQMSQLFTQVLDRIDCFFAPYALRHHYAYRNLLDRVDTALSARYMGHRVDIHQEVYWLCIDKTRDRQIRQKHLPASPESSADRTGDN